MEGLGGRKGRKSVFPACSEVAVTEGRHLANKNKRLDRQPASKARIEKKRRFPRSANQKLPSLQPDPGTAKRTFGTQAHLLCVYDGRRFAGSIVDQDIAHGRWKRLGPAHAFDAENRPLGIFRNRREAMAAVAARDEFEKSRHASCHAGRRATTGAA